MRTTSPSLPVLEGGGIKSSGQGGSPSGAFGSSIGGRGAVPPEHGMPHGAPGLVRAETCFFREFGDTWSMGSSCAVVIVILIELSCQTS